MKKAGIVGGLGPASTLDYYRDIVENYRLSHGGNEYPEVIIDSIRMHELIAAMENNDLDHVAQMLLDSIKRLKQGGADFAAIASNTPHIVWDKIKDKAVIPVLSIIEANCRYIRDKKYQKVLVFGTKFTMQNGLYDQALKKHGIEAVLPNDEDIQKISSIIYPNLENGIIIPEEKQNMIDIAEKYIASKKADALLLGCTEIPLMIHEGDVSVPVIDTTKVHVAAIGQQIEA